MLCYYAECGILFTIMPNVIMLSVIMLNDLMLSVVILSVVKLNVVMPSVVMLSVIMLSVVAPLAHLSRQFDKICRLHLGMSHLTL
jgi:hypothetical protein